jgi:hypothetical protein
MTTARSGSADDRRRGLGELVTADEIAERLQLSSKQVVLDWRLHNNGFPHPVGRARKLLWRWDEVHTWAAAHPAHVAHFGGRSPAPATPPSTESDTRSPGPMAPR